MKLATFRTSNGTQAGRIENDEIVALPYGDVGELLRSGEGWLQSAGEGGGARIPFDQADLAPTVMNPSKILCLGLNYLDHVEEGAAPDLKRPEYPTLFAMFSDSLCGARDRIALPKASQKVDWEVELVIVIGKTVRNVDEEGARAAIGGYAVANDVSMRDWQMRTTEWLQGKAWDACTPVGPMVTSDELGTDGKPDIAIRCDLDGVTMQQSRTSNLLFDCLTSVAYVSTFATLRPGDLIFTGTCSGVGFARKPPVFIQPGQTLTTSIEGIGECVNEFYAEGA